MKEQNKDRTQNPVAVQAVAVKQATEIHTLAEEIIKATGEVAGRYKDLCLYIRNNKVAPKLVSFELGRLGFKRSRISEINRVANAPDKLWHEYEAKIIGFDKALELTRKQLNDKGAEIVEVTEAGKVMVSEGTMTEAEIDDLSEVKELKQEGKKKSSPANRAKSLAHALAKCAVRNAVYRFADAQYEVTVEKIPVTKPSVGA